MTDRKNKLREVEKRGEKTSVDKIRVITGKFVEELDFVIRV